MTVLNRRGKNLLFAEMVTALLFFVISFAVIIRVFAAADSLERKSQRNVGAALCAQSIAEAYSTSGDVNKALELVFGEGVSGGRVALDNDFQPQENGGIILTLSEVRESYSAGIYSTLDISFERSGEEIYSLECSAYVPEGGASDEQ